MRKRVVGSAPYAWRCAAGLAALMMLAVAGAADDWGVATVSNIKIAIPIPGLVEISYDLAQSNGKPCYVDARLSKDGGASYDFWLTTASATGDIGSNITPGTAKKIVWKESRDYVGERMAQAKMRVRAGEMPPPGEPRTFAGIDFVYCPAGTFQMGATANEQDSWAGDKPQHQVTLTQGFWMSKYEVTQAQWRAVTGTNPSTFSGDNRPVEAVSWNDIAASGGFLEKLNTSNPGQGFRLPTEAEWEYACRAGTTTRFYWGDDPSYSQIGNYAWYVDNSGSQTHEVGGKLPNAWGLYDMSGNVWEWCQDWYGSYAAGAVSDPQGTSTGSYRLLRGGSWLNGSDLVRSAHRNYNGPDHRYDSIGFRVVCPGGAN